MPTYLYCLVSSGAPVSADVRGIDGAAVRALAPREGRLGVAWVSDLDIARVDATVERARAHDAVCSAALALGATPLPMRFGQLFADDDSCLAALGRHAASLGARCDRVAGCVEYRIVVGGGGGDDHPSTARTPRAAPAAVGAGRAYLEQVATAARREASLGVRCADVAATVDAVLTAAIGVRLRDRTACAPGRGATAVVAHLVERDGAATYRDIVSAALGRLGDDCVLLGPYPPYSFAGDV